MAHDDERWNHNIHYHPRVLRAAGRGAQTALDVGCGEGMLARALRSVVPSVTAIDSDAVSIELARAEHSDVAFILGDFLTHPFGPESFDLICSVATLHHMDATAALTRMVSLLRPGGTLVVIGCARSQLRDLPYDVVSLVVNRHIARRRTEWEHPSPIVWPPPLSYSDMHRHARDLLPGSRFRRHLLWRYSITWMKPVP